MSHTTDLLHGLAQMLADAGVVTYNSDGTPYTAGQTGLFFKDMPPDPDRVVVLTPFGANSDQPLITLGHQPVQVRCRGTADPLDVDTLADAVFTVLHGATNLTFGSVHVVQILRTNSIPLGMDEQSLRWERSDNYGIDVDLPASTYRS